MKAERSIIRIFVFIIIVILVLLVWYKLKRHLDYFIATPVHWSEIRCVPGMVITTAAENVSDLLSYRFSALRIIGYHYPHYALVIIHNNKLCAIEWRGFTEVQYKIEVIPLRIGNIYIHPLDKYLREIYFSHPSTFKIFYPPIKKEIPFCIEWIREIDQEGFMHCCIFVHRYLAKSGILNEKQSFFPQLLQYTPSMVAACLEEVRYKARYYRCKT